MEQKILEQEDYQWAIIIALHYGIDNIESLFNIFPPKMKEVVKKNFYELSSSYHIYQDSRDGKLKLNTDKKVKKVIAQYLSKEELERI